MSVTAGEAVVQALDQVRCELVVATGMGAPCGKCAACLSRRHIQRMEARLGRIIDLALHYGQASGDGYSRIQRIAVRALTDDEAETEPDDEH